MIKRVDNPEDLSKVINAREPAELQYSLGEEDKRSELIVTHLKEGAICGSDRITKDPKIRLYNENGGISMDFIPQDDDAEGSTYRNLRPKSAVFEQPEYSPDKYDMGETHPPEIGDLTLDLGDGEVLGVTQMYRAA